MKEPQWLFPCKGWEPVTRFWLYTVGTVIQVCLHRLLIPSHLQDFDQLGQVSVFMMFLWKAQIALRLGAGTANTRLSKTLWI